MLRDDRVEATNMSQSPSFFFIDLRHVVADYLDLQEDEMRSRVGVGLMRTYSFLNAVRLEGSEPSK